MKIHRDRFNIYLCFLVALGLACGCSSPEKKRKKQYSSLQLHQELPRGRVAQGELVTIHKDPLVQINVDPQAFLTEGYVKEAKVIDIVGGYALSIQFDRKGTWLLENYSGASLGRRIAVFSQFAYPPLEENQEKGRWLGAIKVSQRISDGLLIFSPEVTRQEAEQVALGLNNVAKRADTNSKYNW